MFYQKFQQEGNNSRGDKRQHQGWWQELAPTAGCAPTTVPSGAWTRPLFPRKGKRAGGSSTSHVVFICLQYFKPIGTTRSLETFPSLFFFLEYIWKKSLQDITDLGLIQKAGSDALQKGRSVHILMWAHLLHPPRRHCCAHHCWQPGQPHCSSLVDKMTAPSSLLISSLMKAWKTSPGDGGKGKAGGKKKGWDQQTNPSLRLFFLKLLTIDFFLPHSLPEQGGGTCAVKQINWWIFSMTFKGWVLG